MKALAAYTLATVAFSAAPADLPDPVTTPGAVNLSVTPSNIRTTICVPGWTSTIRPPASYTTKLKIKQMAAGPYASPLGASSFEEDHLVSLELGGHPQDPRNLWPQHWSRPQGAHEKDAVENKLHKLVCTGGMPLAQAQREIATNWIAAYRQYVLRRAP
jgi:hypothetical protein